MTNELQPELSVHFTLAELSERAGTTREFILELVDLGVLHPQTDHNRLHFAVTDLTRLQCAHRLHRDLDVNPAGIAMSLDLLDEVNQLRREITELRGLLRRMGDF